MQETAPSLITSPTPDPVPDFKAPPSEVSLYLKVAIFGAVLFGILYGYTSWLGIPNVLNKTAADTSILLISLSMAMSAVGYFWNTFDSTVRYRKYLGLVGFAFGVAHLILSFSAFQSLLQAETWQKGAMWPALTGLLALIIFTIMTLISNHWMTQILGGKRWRMILRVGYVAMVLILIHVVLLKSGRWVTWFEAGIKTPPSTSLLVTVFVIVVLILRLAMEISLRRKK